MSQPAIIDLNPIYKNCDWSIVLTFPYTITNLDYSAKIIVPDGDDIVMTTSILDSTRLKLSLTAAQINGLELTNYEYTLQQTTDKKPVAKGKLAIAEFEV